MHYRIAVIAGDGIGGEVTPAALHVLDAATEVIGLRQLEQTHLPWGSEYYARHGRMMPNDGLDLLGEHDAILLGAIGRPEGPDHVAVWGLIMPIRQGFRQYVNLRPTRLLPGVESPLISTSSSYAKTPRASTRTLAVTFTGATRKRSPFRRAFLTKSDRADCRICVSAGGESPAPPSRQRHEVQCLGVRNAALGRGLS